MLSGRIHQDDIAGFCDLSESTFSHWKKSWVVGDDSVDKIFSSVRELLDIGTRTIPTSNTKKLKKNQKSTYTVDPGNAERAKTLLKRFHSAYIDGRIGIYDTGKALGMEIVECQKIIDTLIYDKIPLFSGIYYGDKTNADNIFYSYGGIYLLWVKRQNIWLQAPLRVRYVLEIRKHSTIRCKLNAPILAVAGNWEYDGFLTSRENRNYWIFEKRISERYDHFYFITTRGFDFTPLNGIETDRKTLTMRGRYLSADQDQAQTVVGDVILLQRQNISGEENEIEFMHTQARRLNNSESDAVQRHADAFDQFLLRDHVVRGINDVSPFPLGVNI